MRRFYLAFTVLALNASSCRQQGLTRTEASEALEESKLSTQAAALTAGSVEITTNFTIGGAVEAAAEELRIFYAEQLPCAAVSREGNTLAVDYGVNGTCSYRGQSYRGSHSISVSRNDANDVVVDHLWQNFRNDEVEVNGAATVTWSRHDPSRHIQHELYWERLADGRAGMESGDRIQRPLASGIDTGFSVDGTRHWRGKQGDWDLSINDVEMRWVDPVPQSGSYSLDTPFDKQVTLAFDRIDDTTIQVTVSGGDDSFDFDVRSAGAAE
ncbi:MAG TPA: hypothetical protein VFU02_21485 [Polyangiaceae bacterium]|nr:hypothetical protein [Polyangiaceae bacterium]